MFKAIAFKTNIPAAKVRPRFQLSDHSLQHTGPTTHPKAAPDRRLFLIVYLDSVMRRRPSEGAPPWPRFILIGTAVSDEALPPDSQLKAQQVTMGMGG